MNLLLDGYAELAGYPVRAETGQLIIRLNRLIGAFDDEYEERLGDGRSLDLGDVFAGELVQERLFALGDFLQAYPERRAIQEFLTDRLSGSYGRYVALTQSKPDFDRLYESVVLDSGGLGECLAHVIGLFNGAAPDPETVEQFSSFGIVGKLADDVIDFWTDLAQGRTNVLIGLVQGHPEEHERVLQTASRTARGRLKWWRLNCPDSFVQLMDLIEEHRARLKAPSLRLAGDLTLLPACRGGLELRSAPVGLRI
ncbi:hypothetical protein [Streptomyces sp. NRRL S-118]|uniref:hypothetical protein n=1 Tax=Streptomyces sp. NRRL S-118 TaxID=1463881 RepID=UPI0004C7AF91|nr:hypothetical protein [Streptomyces sp. NRRL S-118]